MKDMSFPNIDKPTVVVKHSELTRFNDSEYKSICPCCKEGILFVARSQEEPWCLLNNDICGLCGQHFQYSDIPDNKWIVLENK